MSSLCRQKLRTEVFFAVLLAYIAKTLQYVVLMVVWKIGRYSLFV